MIGKIGFLMQLPVQVETKCLVFAHRPRVSIWRPISLDEFGTATCLESRDPHIDTLTLTYFRMPVVAGRYGASQSCGNQRQTEKKVWEHADREMLSRMASHPLCVSCGKCSSLPASTRFSVVYSTRAINACWQSIAVTPVGALYPSAQVPRMALTRSVSPPLRLRWTLLAIARCA